MIYLGSDHGGYQLKQHIMEFLQKKHLDFIDLGNKANDPDDDYPDYAFKVAEEVASHKGGASWKDQSKGVLMCRSAAGMVIAANKIRGIRAFAAFDEQSAKHTREHNDANIIALSGEWMDVAKAERILNVWLETRFSNEERHVRRLKKIQGVR